MVIMQKKLSFLIPIILAFIALIVFTSPDKPIPEEPIAEVEIIPTPDFAAITDSAAKKEAFFNYLVPFVIEKNKYILNDRAELTRIINSESPPNREEKKWIAALRKIFKLKKVEVYTREDLEAIYPHLDIIPPSLVLAQAANESAWGTSRFALEGNNYFGQWCFRKGCGLVPASRDHEAKHEVRRFKGAKESVFAYIDNLNTNAAYRPLRKTRAQLRADNKEITGLELVEGILPYSQRGQAYVEEIRNLINYNKLWRFNQNPN
ncbi:flagellar biosynthesis protein FlgJ [Marinomonas agarivorans]|nr:flagellar biosynthesis protein FlgJ [Marinomonas agarivorans]